MVRAGGAVTDPADLKARVRAALEAYDAPCPRCMCTKKLVMHFESGATRVTNRCRECGLAFPDSPVPYNPDDALGDVRALLEALDAAEEAARTADMCDGCAGTGEALSGPCGCGGTGKLGDMLTHVRLQLHAAEAERDRLREARMLRDDTIKTLIKELAERMDGVSCVLEALALALAATPPADREQHPGRHVVSPEVIADDLVEGFVNDGCGPAEMSARIADVIGGERQATRVLLNSMGLVATPPAEETTP